MAEETGNKKKTAKAFGVDPSQIRSWIKNKEKIKEIAKTSPRKFTTHSGPKRSKQKSEVTPAMKSAFVTPLAVPSTSQRTATKSANHRTTLKMGSEATLVSLPASPFAARARMVIYDKGLDANGTVTVEGPDIIGGFRTEEMRAKFREVSPMGKVPVLLVGADKKEVIVESGVITEYLVEKYTNGRSYIPPTPLERARQRQIASLLDQYIEPYHFYMYRFVDEGVDRAKGVEQMHKGWDAIEYSLHETGPYVSGSHIGVGDAALWGCMPFYDFMLRAFFGWHPADKRPKLARWMEHMKKEENAAKVYDEVWDALQDWYDKGRWTKLGVKTLVEPSTLKLARV